METMSVNDLTVFFDASERGTAELIGSACAQSVQLIQEHWGLDTPEECRVYVMTSGVHFFFHSAPWPWRILLGISVPLWYFRVKRLWPYAEGWTQHYGKRAAIGVKPPRLLQLNDGSRGARFFVKEEDMDEKVRKVTCHELVHACTGHLKLPVWLHEGLAIVTVDKLLQRSTVKGETIDLLGRSSQETDSKGYRRTLVEDQDAFVYHIVRGYWLTRYLEHAHPELLKSLLARRHKHAELESRMAAALGMEHQAFWGGIDEVLVSYFS